MIYRNQLLIYYVLLLDKYIIMKDTIYFRHDYDAHADPKIVKLRMKFWWEWYGIFWAILETMRSDADIVMNLCDVDANAYRLHCDTKLLHDILLYLVDIWLLIEDGWSYYSERLQEDVEYMREKSSKARKSAEERWKKRDKNANALQTQSESNAIKDSIWNDIKEIYILSEQEVKEKIKEIYTEQIVNNNIAKYRLLLLFIMKWYNIQLDKKHCDKFFADMIDKSHRYGYSWEWFADRDTLLLKAKEMYERAEWWREMKNHMSTLNKFLSPNPKK